MPSTLTNHSKVRAKPGGSEHDGDLRRFILGKLKAAGEKVRIIHDSHSFFGIMYVYKIRSCDSGLSDTNSIRFEVANGTMSPLETLDQEVLEDIQVREVVQHK